MQQISNRKRQLRYSAQKYRHSKPGVWPELPLILLWWLGWPVAELRERKAHLMLCPRCKELLRQSGKAKLRAQNAAFRISCCESVFASNDHLDSLGDDCELCLIFKSTISERAMELAMRNKRDMIYQTPIVDDGRKSFHVTYRKSYDEFDRKVSHALEFQYYIHEDPVNPRIHQTLSLADSKEPCFQGLPARASPLEGSTNSTSTFILAKTWLLACTAHHLECSRTKSLYFPHKSELFLPTRIIDIGSGSDISPRLRCSVEISGISRYLTLSHCWGGEIPGRLLQCNEVAMKQSIKLHTLSQTFQDAFIVTRALGLQYIWIDALCIIQDSEDDWEVESAQMCDIYSNSFCNIAATASVDGSEGLFRQRGIAHSIRPLTVRVANKAHKIVDGELWKREIEAAPLNKRAWVCQELTLAPRTLHFAATQVFWECNRSTYSESFPLGFPSCVGVNFRMALHQDLESIRQHGLCSKSNKVAISQVDLFKVWTTIVELYNKGALTYETDKLVAIGGIAEEIHHSLKIEYSAGLWQRDFARQLLWQCYSLPSNHASRPKNYIAPSWSWASVVGQITYSSPETFRLVAVQDLVKVRSISVELEGINLFGQAKGGVARLEGKLFQLRLGSLDGDCERVGLDKCHAEVWVGEECFTKVWLTVSRDISWIGDREIPWRHDDLYCLPVQCGPVYSWNLETLMRGLLLERVGLTGEFKRYGTFSVCGNVSMDILQAGQRSFEKRAGESGLEYVEDCNGGYNYLVQII